MGGKFGILYRQQRHVTTFMSKLKRLSSASSRSSREGADSPAGAESDDDDGPHHDTPVVAPQRHASAPPTPGSASKREGRSKWS